MVMNNITNPIMWTIKKVVRLSESDISMIALIVNSINKMVSLRDGNSMLSPIIVELVL